MRSSIRLVAAVDVTAPRAIFLPRSTAPPNALSFVMSCSLSCSFLCFDDDVTAPGARADLVGHADTARPTVRAAGVWPSRARRLPIFSRGPHCKPSRRSPRRTLSPFVLPRHVPDGLSKHRGLRGTRTPPALGSLHPLP